MIIVSNSKRSWPYGLYSIQCIQSINRSLSTFSIHNVYYNFEFMLFFVGNWLCFIKANRKKFICIFSQLIVCQLYLYLNTTTLSSFYLFCACHFTDDRVTFISHCPNQYRRCLHCYHFSWNSYLANIQIRRLLSWRILWADGESSNIIRCRNNACIDYWFAYRNSRMNNFRHIEFKI